MRRLLLILCVALLAGPLLAQTSDPPTMEESPDTVANLGTRKEVRQLINWNALRNRLDREDIDTLQFTVGDSATYSWLFVPTDTATATEGTVYYDSDVDSLYLRTATGWVGLNGGGGGSGIQPGDTAAMLEPYLLEEDTAAMLAAYLLISDTAAMLEAYITEAGDLVGDTLTDHENRITAIEADLEDTVSVPYTLFVFAFTDSAQMVDERTYFTFWYAGPDSIDIDSTVAFSMSASPNFQFNIQFSQSNDASGSWTDVFNTAPTVNGADATSTGEVDTPDNNAIPPRRWIRLIIKDTTDNPLYGATITVCGKYY